MLNNKDYCDYKTCVALKELGYAGYSKYFYTAKEPKKLQQNGQLYFTIRTATACGYVLAIHLWDAQKWLREEKQIDISITLYMEGYAATIKHFYVFEREFAWTEPIISQCCKSYEEALLEGIKEAVKLLKEERK